MRIILLLILVLALTACAISHGSNFNENLVQELRPGMTEQEVTQALGGKPGMREYKMDGSYIAAWQFVRTNALTLKSEGKDASLLFDKNNRFVRVVDFGKIITE